MKSPSICNHEAVGTVAMEVGWAGKMRRSIKVDPIMALRAE